MNLSIIIPARNEASRITDTVRSARELQPHEIIVVDGQSDDQTAEIASLEACQVISSAPGRAIQQNVGSRAATGDLLLFLHADNWLEPQAAEQISSAFANPNTQAAAFRHVIDASGWMYRLLEWNDAMRVRWGGMAYGDQGLLFRREVFEELGGFEEIPLMEDVRIMRAFRRRYRRFPVLLPGPLHISARRWQTHGIFRQSLRNCTLRWSERFGVSPTTLARRYAPHWKAPDSSPHHET